jgi:uncharacterized NAD(P)/FAD-binding protein YdhS
VSEFIDIVIVGGGYSGSVLALHLARQLGSGSTVAIIEPRAEWGAGLAYSTLEDDHKINVPADRMGVSAQPKDRFDNWLKEHHPELVGDGHPEHSYVARRWFGVFVRERLAETLARTDAKVSHLRATATDARQIEGGIEISLAERGPPVRGHLVAIATSHGVPAMPAAVPQSLRTLPKFIDNPWQNECLAEISPDDDVLIIGTGLTMADVAALLLQRGHRGRITAMSRHGLLARKNGPSAAPRDLDFATWPEAPLTTYVKMIRAEIACIEGTGGSWRNVFTALREQSERLWSKLPIEEKRRFLRHLKCFYDVHRYRMAPETAELIEAARSKGQIEILAAGLSSVRREADGFSIAFKRRGSAAIERAAASAIVNCTGPKQQLRADSSHFLGALIERGLISTDPLGLGVAVDHELRIIGQCRNLYALGPLTRARFGDTVGAPEIMAQAERLAGIMTTALAEMRAAA